MSLWRQVSFIVIIGFLGSVIFANAFNPKPTVPLNTKPLYEQLKPKPVPHHWWEFWK